MPTPGDTNKNNTIVVLASETRAHGGLNAEAVVTAVPDASTFKYSVTAKSSLSPWTATSGGSVLAEKAPDEVPGVPGPYLYDPVRGISVTSIEVAIAQDLNGNQTYGFVNLDTGLGPDPSLAFPDEVGYLAFKFGSSNVVGPVKYYGRLGDTALILDASFRFPSTVPSGSTAVLLSSRTPFQPERGDTAGSFYATGSAAGRIAAEKQLGDTFAVGLQTDVEVVYPGDRGLGGEGLPSRGVQKLSDKVVVWAGDDPDSEVPKARNH